MLEILFGGVLPVFAIGAIGFAFARSGTFDLAMASAINRFVFYVAIPALGFRLLVNAPISEFNFPLLAGFLGTELIVYGSVFAISRYLFKTDLKEAILLGMATALTNHILFVLPIAITLFGEAASAPIVAIISMDIIIVFIATLITMEIMTSGGARPTQVAGKLLRNPPVVSIILGLTIGLSGLGLPDSIDVFLSFTGAAAAPCALFALGIVLGQRQAKGRVLLPLSLTAMKLLVQPALVWILLVATASTGLALTAPVMMVAAAPSGAMAFVLALNYGVRVDAIARTILYTSAASLLTLTFAASL